ncbi:hypothetical protein PHJA_001630900 [Phtheirospermum japonicum]|uniref:Uncharacterized protein n=1 Tax=Phtheirospermum japonicum TaxID=374723 RepID=A0A830CI98_9LAMI|nr:hypothetical protein PHJA_001630900 [Phtheirospermum japonicum]
MFFLLQSIAGGRSQSTKALETLASVDPVNRQRHSTSYCHSVPSDEVRRAVATDFTSGRLCFALWIADTGNSPQIEYMNI